MPRLIDADALMEEIEFEYDLNYGEILTDPRKFADMVEDSLTVDAVEVVHGRWRYYSTTMQECSNCQRHTARHKFKYCPHCGAIMEDKYHE